MMDDYIKRKEAIQQMRRFIGYIGIDEDMCERFKIALNQISAADVAPVKYGRWILEYEPNGKPYCFHCSVCDEDFHYIGITTKYNYCPNCGAKMTHNK